MAGWSQSQEAEQTRGVSLGIAKQNVIGLLETSGLRWKPRLKMGRTNPVAQVG